MLHEACPAHLRWSLHQWESPTVVPTLSSPGPPLPAIETLASHKQLGPQPGDHRGATLSRALGTGIQWILLGILDARGSRKDGSRNGGPSFSCPAWFQGPPHSRAGVSLHPSLCKRGVRGQSWDPASLGTCWPQLFWALVSHLLSVEPAPGDGPAAASQQELFGGAHILRPPEGQPSF